jgi:hypothetical protein
MMCTTGVGRNFGGGSVPNQGLRKCQLIHTCIIYLALLYYTAQYIACAAL